MVCETVAAGLAVRGAVIPCDCAGTDISAANRTEAKRRVNIFFILCEF